MYEHVIDDLRRAYDASAGQRDAGEISPWKAAERARFADRLLAEGRRDLLEIGAGPGHHAAYFRDRGLAVTCTDLSPAMVECCRAKGLTAHVMDFLSLDFPSASFDAVFSLNCLLHVPSADLDRVLAALDGLLRPGGLLYYGVYGGGSFEGVWPDDRHDPPRYFVFYPDDELLRRAGQRFDVVDFHTVAIDRPGDDQHFQALTLRRRERAA